MRCSICGEKIPNKRLVDMGYTFTKIDKRFFAFCPKHSRIEIADFLIKAIMEDEEGEG